MRFFSVDFPEGGHCQSETNPEFKPRMDCYLRDDQTVKKPRPAVIVLPGGGYHFCSVREGEPLALAYLNAGFQTFVVWYTVYPSSFPKAITEVAFAMQEIIKHKDEWNIDPSRIFVEGSSAGGHLAASYATYYDADFVKEKPFIDSSLSLRPCGAILSYPVITSGEKTHARSCQYLLEGADPKWTKEDISLEKKVRDDQPPVFIWATMTDESVPVENTLYYINALHEKHIPLEAHLYPSGRHGLSLCNMEVAKKEEETVLRANTWFEDSVRWIKSF